MIIPGVNAKGRWSVLGDALETRLRLPPHGSAAPK